MVDSQLDRVLLIDTEMWAVKLAAQLFVESEKFDPVL